MPTQDRIGSDDRRDVLQSPATQELAFDGQAAALIVTQHNSFLAVYFLEDLILGAEVLHHGLLLAVEPPGEDDKQELPGSQDEIHGSPNAVGEQKRATSGMTFGVSTGRNRGLSDVYKARWNGYLRFG